MVTWTREEAVTINKASTARAGVDYVIGKLDGHPDLVEHLEQVGVALIEITQALIEHADAAAKSRRP